MKPVPLNIPNILSLYRLVSFPLVLWLALAGVEKWFVLLLCINLITDILDGFIARRFNMMTEIGARLDSLADIGTYILAFVGIWCFKLTDFEPHFLSFGIFLLLFLISRTFSFFKFGKFTALHLYTSKICGYIQGIFFFVLFVFGFNSAFYYFMIVTGCLAFIEHILVQVYMKELTSNAKGLYWVLKENQ